MTSGACGVPALCLAALAGCGLQPQRSELAEKEIAQCVAGMAGVIPDDKQRQIVCECTADAKFSPKLDATAFANSADECRKKAGMNPNDPFGILNKNGEARQPYDKVKYSNMQ